MQSVAQAWLAYRITGSATWLGVIAFATHIPSFVLAPWGGVVADRASRRRILIATQASAMGLAFVLAGLTLTGRVTLPWLVALATLLGVTHAFDIPARQAFVVEMVGREDLLNAIALNSSLFNGARIVGPAIAGFVVARVGEGWCFFVNGVSFLAVLASLLRMRMPPFLPRPTTVSATASLIEGFRFLYSARPVRALLLLLALVALTAMPYTVLLPVVVDRVLTGGPGLLGLLMGATGVGALVGAVVLALRDGVRGLGRWVAISSASLGLALAALSRVRSTPLAVALLVAVGFFMMSQMASSNTLLQSLVPDELRGRAMAAFTMMFKGMAPFGALAAGAAAERFGAPATLAAGGLVALAGALVFASRIPALRVEARRMIVALEAAAGDPAAAVTSARGD